MNLTYGRVLKYVRASIIAIVIYPLDFMSLEQFTDGKNQVS